ncbi:hypothetical protein ACX3SV_16045 [Hafnia paralvei]
MLMGLNTHISVLPIHLTKKNMKKNNLEKELFLYSSHIQKLPNFRTCVEKHYDLMLSMCKTHPLFYKTMFKDTRFNIAITVLCFYFTQKAPTLSDVKNYCVNHGLGSHNSLESLMFFLRVGGRLNVFKSEKDKRILLFNPTEKGLNETRRYLANSLAIFPELLPDYRLEKNHLDSYEGLEKFFIRCAELFFNDVIVSNILPDSQIFLLKDAGHMIFIRLYLEALKQKENPGVATTISYSQIAKETSVSRTHLRRIVDAAAKKSLMTPHENMTLTLHDSFITLAEEYMGLYFAFVLYCLEINPSDEK